VEGRHLQIGQTRSDRDSKEQGLPGEAGPVISSADYTKYMSVFVGRVSLFGSMTIEQ